MIEHKEIDFSSRAETVVRLSKVEETAYLESLAGRLEKQRIAAIKAKAGEAIESLVPVFQQLNRLTRVVELLDKALSGNSLTPAEQRELSDARTTWAQIKAIRIASDLAESEGTDVEDFNP